MNVFDLTVFICSYFDKGVMNLKDRLTIQMDADLRTGNVRFDGWVLPAKIMDLPTIIESHKTLDNKNFYKTADISQLMICKEDGGEDAKEIEPVEENIKKTKDGLLILGQILNLLNQFLY